MNIPFFKYQGTGNDFIIIDDRESVFPINDSLIKKICDRKFGIGSDGLILIQKSESSDFYMDFFNPDASKSFCGNGSRCAVAFCFRMGIISTSTHFNAIDGEHFAEILSDNKVKISLKDVLNIQVINNDIVLDTGSPHYVRFVKSLEEENIIKTGHSIRYSNDYHEKGINVNLVEIKTDSTLLGATYERGVEDETLSCGTGVTAMAIAANKYANLDSPISLQTKGGHLTVSFSVENGTYHKINLTGPAIMVYKGEIAL